MKYLLHLQYWRVFMIQYEVPEPLILRKKCVQGRKLLFLLLKYSTFIDEDFFKK